MNLINTHMQSKEFLKHMITTGAYILNIYSWEENLEV